MWLLIIVMVNWKAFDTQPFDKQRAYLESVANPGHQFVCAFGGLQSGKSLVGADGTYLLGWGDNPVTLPEQVRGKTPMEIWIVSKSYSLVDTAVATFRMRTPQGLFLSDRERKRLGVNKNDSRTWILRPRTGCADPLPVILRGRTASDPENLRATPSLGIVWGDEIAHWKELAWKNLQGRAIVARTKFLITTTPKGKNWLYRDLYVPGMAGDPKIAVHQWRSVDNPYADKEYLDKLRLKFGPEYAAQELEALFTANQGYVYDFDRAAHMAAIPSSDPDDYKARVVGVDPGYGDPYAASLWLKDWEDRWWLADEMYLPSKAIVDDAFPKLKHWADAWKVTAFYVDKRRPSDWSALRRKGLNALPNVDVFGEDDRRTVMPMVRMVQRLFREGRIKIAPHCEWHAEEFENYSFKDSEDKNAGENPIDFRNHAMDADRYAICSVDALPEDRRPRYRHGMDMKPRARGRDPRRDPREKVTIPNAREYLLAVDQRMNAAERPGRRNGRG